MHEHDKRKTIEDYTQKEIASVGKFNNNQLDKIWQECLPQNSSYDLKEKSSSVSAQFQKRQNDKVSLAQTEPSDECILHDLNVSTNSFIPNTAVQQRNIIYPVNQNNDQCIPVRITQRRKSRPIRKKSTRASRNLNNVSITKKGNSISRCNERTQRLRNLNMTSNVHQRRNTKGFRMHTRRTDLINWFNHYY